MDAARLLGKAVADMLINRLVQTATVTVIERAAIDKLLAEQNLTNSDRTDALTAAKLGRVLGVDATARRLNFEILVDQNCGYRGLEPGLPKQ